MPTVRIERLTGADAYELVEPLMTEYLEFIATLMTELGVDVGDHRTFVEGRHQALRDEVPRLTSGRGRVLVAGDAEHRLGIGILKPVDETTAEVKRMYVRPAARGKGVGRALLEQLLTDAAHENFRTIRIETMDALTASISLYESCGFTAVPAFNGSEVAAAGATTNARYLEAEIR